MYLFSYVVKKLSFWNIQINNEEVDDRSGWKTYGNFDFDMFLVEYSFNDAIAPLGVCRPLILYYWRNVELISDSEVRSEFCDTTINCLKNCATLKITKTITVSCQAKNHHPRLKERLTHYYGSLYSTACGNIMSFHSERLPAGKAASENVIFQTSQSQICYQPVISWKAVF